MGQSEPLRVLLITEPCSGGVGRHVLDLMEQLSERGCDVELIYSDRRIDDTFRSRLAARPEHRSHVIPMRRAPHPSDWSVVQQVRRFITTRGPFDIVHGHSSKAGAIARVRGISKHASIVFTPHCIATLNQNLSSAVRCSAMVLERYLARRADAIIAVSPEEREHLLDLGLSSSKLHCIPNGIEWPITKTREVLRQELGLPRRGVIVGSLGRLDEAKDPALLLSAFALLCDIHRDVHLAIVGQGEMEPQMKRMAEHLGIQNRISWLGYLRADEAMPAFDLFALSSLYEGMPYTLIEALAAGLPIVSTPVGGTRLAVDNGRNGFLVQQHEKHEFAKALRTLVDSLSLRREFSAASREKSQSLTLERMVDRTLGLYQRVAGRSFEATDGRETRTEIVA